MLSLFISGIEDLDFHMKIQIQQNNDGSVMGVLIATSKQQIEFLICS